MAASQLTGVGAHLFTARVGTFAHHRPASVKFAVFMTAIKACKLFCSACTEIAVFPTPFGEAGRVVLDNSLYGPDKASYIFWGNWGITENNRSGLLTC